MALDFAGAAAPAKMMASPFALPERLFISIALCFGIAFAFVVPPIQFADEDSHFKKAFAVSTGDLLPHAIVDEKGAHYGNTLPRAVVEFVEQHRYMIGRTDAKYRYQDLYLRTAVPVDRRPRQFDSYSAAPLDPLVYMPPALGMAFGRLCYAIVGARELYTPAAHLYFGRLFNLFFFVACVSWAIRLTPVAKSAFVTAALLPMCMAVASSVNRDGTVIAVAFLFTSLVLHLARRPARIRRTEFVALFALALALLVGKYVYFSLVALLLVIPADRWGPGRARWKAICGLVVACLGVQLLEAAYVARLARGAVSAEGTAARQQLAHVLNHPWQSLSLFFATPFRNRIGWLVGILGNLGWLDTNYPYPFLAIPAVALVATALFDPGGARGLALRHKLLSVAILIATTLALELGFYVMWTSLPQEGGIGADVITGIQGRYFLPLVPLALVALRNDLTAGWAGACRLVQLCLPAVLVTTQVVTLFVLLLRYWVP